MKRIDKLLLSHLFIAFVIISLFTSLFEKPASIMILHVLLICSVYTTAFYFSRLFRSYFQHIATLLFTCISTALIFMYIANFLSNMYWNNNVSFSFIITYLADLNTVLEEVPFGVETLLLASVLLTTGIYLIYKIKVSYLHTFDKNLSLSHSRLYIVITLITTSYASISFARTAPGLWDGEPLSNLALKTSTQNYRLGNSEGIFFNENSSQFINTKQQNIILIHADALRADHMSSYGYTRKTTPYIETLIDDGATQINMGLSICSESVCGMLAALGSRHPDIIQAETPLIHNHLKKAGYRTVFSGSGNFSWERLDSILSSDIDHFDRADTNPDFSVHDDSIILSTLSKMPDYDGIPTFFFLRYLSPHPIGRHFSQYRKFTPAEKNLIGYLFPSTINPQTSVNAYDNSIIQMDDMLRQSIEILNSKGYMENSLIVIYGDHGDALNEHGYYGHYNNLYQEEIHVPIIFKSSKKLDIQKSSVATLNDILPTILDINNITVPENIDGISLLRADKPHLSFHDSRTGIYAVVTQTNNSLYKLIYNRKTGEAFLYDLNKDPSESTNIKDQQQTITQAMLNKLKLKYSLTN